MKQLWFVLAIAACGGKSPPARRAPGPTEVPPAPPATPCDITARKLTDAVFKWKEPPPTSQDNVFSVLNKLDTRTYTFRLALFALSPSPPKDNGISRSN